MPDQPSEALPPQVATPVCYRHPDRQTRISCQRCGRPICPDCMVSASVGFQCPHCVNEGRRSVRTARTPYGGKIGGTPGLVSYTLIGVNVAVWLAVLASGWRNSPLVHRLSLLPTGVCESRSQPGGVYPFGSRGQAVCDRIGDGRFVPGVSDGAYWQLLTSTFMHVEIWHIAGNMIALFVLGPQLERVLGRSRFLALYLVSGLAGSAVAYVFATPGTTELGASGAIFGLFAALAVVVHKIGGDLKQVLYLLVVNVVITFAVPNVSWQAHLGGFVGGLAVTGILVYAPRARRTQVQALGTGGVLALVVLMIVLRSISLA